MSGMLSYECRVNGQERKNRLSAETIKKIWSVQFNVKNESFEQYLTHIYGIHALLKKIWSTEEYAAAYI
jgi:hypothetical protein